MAAFGGSARRRETDDGTSRRVAAAMRSSDGYEMCPGRYQVWVYTRREDASTGVGAGGTAILAAVAGADAGTSKGIGAQVSQWLGQHLWRRCRLRGKGARSRSPGENLGWSTCSFWGEGVGTGEAEMRCHRKERGDGFVPFPLPFPFSFSNLADGLMSLIVPCSLSASTLSGGDRG